MEANGGSREAVEDATAAVQDLVLAQANEGSRERSSE